MLPSVCVAVPTYWTRPGGSSQPGDAIYDHPTPLDDGETLSALLASLDGIADGTFYLLILAAVSGEDVVTGAERAVSKLVRDGFHGPSLVFGSSELRWLRERLTMMDMEFALDYLKLRDYPTVRNLQLVIPHALRSTAIVALDDDEIVTDPNFLRKATEPLGTTIDGRRVNGLSGYYLQPDGGILLQVDPAKAMSSNIFDRKAAIMNAETEALEAEPAPIVETPFCFGGNMEFSAEMAATVGFDPGITRGEDIDYLINARLEGSTFFLRKNLKILHRPPHGGSYRDTTMSKLSQDIVRFVYEQTKIKASQELAGLCPVTAGQLGEYPGRFLRDDLDREAIEALTCAGCGTSESMEFVQSARREAPDRMRQYLEFRRQWPRIQDRLGRTTAVRDGLLRMANGI